MNRSGVLILLLALYSLTGYSSAAGDLMPWEVDDAETGKPDEPPAAKDPIKPQQPAAAKEKMPWENASQTPVEVDPIVELRRKAESGDLKAQYNLGCEYYSGKMVPRDDKEARKWVMLAAQGGYPRAQYDVGTGHETGTIWEKDPGLAFKWYKKAADNGYHKAMAAVSRCYQYGKGISKDEKKAFAYAKDAASGNDYLCLYGLAQFYEMGVGTEVDLEEALAVYKRSKEAGCKTADKAIARVTELIAAKQKSSVDRKVNAIVDVLDAIIEALPEENQ